MRAAGRLMSESRFTASLFLRALAVVYALAFASLAVQVHGLVGPEGILPIAPWLSAIEANLGRAAYWKAPTVFWFGEGDFALSLVSWGGVAVSAVAALGRLPRTTFTVLWLFYLSLYTVGRVFLGFQWDILLLEVGFAAILLTFCSAPISTTPLYAVAPWALLRWILFKLMLMSGLVKLASGDNSWWDLTALSFHFETQPLPAWTSWYAHHLPDALLKASVAVMHFIELVLPFFIFGPRKARFVAGFGFLLLQWGIMATGNYGFFNLLTCVLCIPLFDDRFFGRAVQDARSVDESRGVTPRFLVAPAAVAGLCAVLLVFGAGHFAARFYSYDVLPWPLRMAMSETRQFHLTSGYGLFASMTKRRPEIKIEGSLDGREWKTYEFKWKPGDPTARPRFVQPHQPRLDWQMWFAALGNYRRNPWLLEFMRRLAAGSEPVLDLMAYNPFDGAPPNYVRARIAEYRFSDGSPNAEDSHNSKAAWWTHGEYELYAPIISRTPERWPGG